MVVVVVVVVIVDEVRGDAGSIFCSRVLEKLGSFQIERGGEVTAVVVEVVVVEVVEEGEVVE